MTVGPGAKRRNSNKPDLKMWLDIESLRNIRSLTA